MILSKHVLINTLKNKKLKHYKSLGYDVSSKVIDVKIEDLPKFIKCKVLVKCEYCEKEHERDFVDYNRIIDKNLSHKYTCSRQCGISLHRTQNKITTIHPSTGKRIEPTKLKNILEKRKKTNLEKWGVEHVLQNEDVKEKFRQTNLSKYGNENYSKTSEFRDKHKETCIERFGVTHHSQSDIVKEKKQKTSLEKFDVKCTLNTKKSNDKRISIFDSEKYRSNYEISKHTNYIRYISGGISEFKCDCNQNHTFETKYDNFKSRLNSNLTLCTVCFPIGSMVSMKECEMTTFISRVYTGEIIKNYRDKYEIDAYLPDCKIGFEFNGIWWHSDKYKDKQYHIDKLLYFKNRGVRIFNIWESDWINKKEIIESQIRNVLGKSLRIYAKQCKIEEIKDIKLAKNFLDSNHLQGFVKSNIKLGLYKEDELVSIMLFDKVEGRKKMPSDEWNLSRFCNVLDISVVGGASKLLKHFTKKYLPKRIISYADRNWSTGNLYYKIGFELLYESGPDYKYLVKDKLINKSRYRKSYTGMSESVLDLPKVWDCGKMKFEILF